MTDSFRPMMQNADPDQVRIATATKDPEVLPGNPAFDIELHATGLSTETRYASEAGKRRAVPGGPFV